MVKRQARLVSIAALNRSHGFSDPLRRGAAELYEFAAATLGATRSCALAHASPLNNGDQQFGAGHV
jgi:hypothetical protein